MSVVYLGFTEELQNIFQTIFNKVFAPVMELLFKNLFNLAFALIKAMFWEILVQGWILLLKLLDFIADIFDIFSGTRYVLYYDGQQHVNTVNQYMIRNGVEVLADPKGAVVNYKQTYLLDLFLDSGPVSRAFFSLSILAAVIAFLFTIYAVAKSVSDVTLDGRNPIGKVLGRALKAALTFLMIPATVFVGLQLSTIVLVKVSDSILNAGGAWGTGKPPTMGTVIFLSGTINAGNESSPSFTDARRNDYYRQIKQYQNLTQVKKDFDIQKIDLVSAYTSTILCIFIMVMALFHLIRRLVEVLLLYLASPFFVAAVPLDDGAMFGKWRDMFIGKVVSAFGTVFSMKLYLVLVPFISGSSIKLNANAEVDALLRLFIIIGGAWAVYKSQHLILEIISPEAAQTASESGAAVAGLALGGAAMLRGAIGGGMGALKSTKTGESGAASSSKQEQEQDGAFKGGTGTAGAVPISGGNVPDSDG